MRVEVINHRTPTYNLGDLFQIRNEVYILAIVDNQNVRLISLSNGNRYDDKALSAFASTQEIYDYVHKLAPKAVWLGDCKITVQTR